MRLILGIESSCDETAASVVADGGLIRSSIVASQIDIHGHYGGVVPELASREHLRAISLVTRESLVQAGIGWKDLSAVAVTCGPGLVGALLVGLTYAKAASLTLGIPLIGVNHIEGHIQAVLLEARQAGKEIDLPALALVASGGHTQIYMVSPNLQYSLLGKTRDDAAGEAYDKVAKLLGFGYPGGPTLDRLAPHGNAGRCPFPMAKMKGNTLDFSFSGLKTAVLRWTQASHMEDEIAVRRALAKRVGRPSVEQWLEVTPQRTLDAVAAFQHVVIEELLRRVERAVENEDARAVLVAGGVASNAGLRAEALSGRLRCPVYFPRVQLSTDNATMIAAAAFSRLDRGQFDDLTLPARANLAL
jgi:N6-L-threonylcarbamoyladenine synthase